MAAMVEGEKFSIVLWYNKEIYIAGRKQTSGCSELHSIDATPVIEKETSTLAIKTACERGHCRDCILVAVYRWR